jgi:Ca2+-binding RTX toxin-like protein
VPDKSAVVSIDGSATNILGVYGGSKAEKIIGGSGKDMLFGNEGNDSIFGGESGDMIFGDAGNDKIYGDTGDDSLNGGDGNDTLTGGAGADLFSYNYGNDVIADYAEEDKISISGGEIASVGVSGKDITFKVGKGSLKIKKGVGQKVSVNDEIFIYEKGVIYNEDKTSASLMSAVKLENTVMNVDGSKMSAALKYSANDSDNEIFGGKGADSILGNGGDDSIFGNAGNDKLFGGDGNDLIDGGAGNDSIFGGNDNDKINGDLGNDKIFGDEGDDILNGDAGNDSIFGGEGNDTLSGGAGKDIFVFESGNDVITDYSAKDDKIKFVDEITDIKVDGENVIFETANGSITVDKGASQKISYSDFKNKNNSYTAASADLFDDNNFMTEEFALDEITEQKFEVQNIETQKGDNLEQNQTILTYGEDK